MRRFLRWGRDAPFLDVGDYLLRRSASAARGKLAEPSSARGSRDLDRGARVLVGPFVDHAWRVVILEGDQRPAVDGGRPGDLELESDVALVAVGEGGG